MKTTIDGAGRVVIPKEIRTRAGLESGTEIDVTLDGFSVRLTRAVSGPRLERVGKRLVARPTAPPEERVDVDIAELVEAERERWPS